MSNTPNTIDPVVFVSSFTNTRNPTFLDLPDELHFSVDIETLDTTPTAAITEIGAVAFCSQKNLELVGGRFFMMCMDPMGSVSSSTLAWRKENNLPFIEPNPESSYEEIKKDPIWVGNVLREFFTWIDGLCAKEKKRPVMWCKGTDFDKIIIQTAAHNRCGITVFPWRYNDFYDMRTLLKVYPQFKVPKESVAHNGLGDAVQQARCIIDIANHVAGNGFETVEDNYPELNFGGTSSDEC